MEIEVRRIRPDDAPLLRRVRLAALLDTPSAFAMTHAEESAYSEGVWKEKADERSRGSDHATFFAMDDGQVVGLVGSHGLDEHTVELVSMWADPVARGRGVGVQLVAAVVEWASGRTVELWVTRGNDAAARLYERCGFTATGDFQALPSDPCRDELRMRRSST